MWFERIYKLIEKSGPHVVVQADDRWGLGFVLAASEAKGLRVLAVDLEESDSSSTVRQGNRLSDGVYCGLGTRLFGLGVPVRYGLSLLRKNRDHLSPVCVVVRNPHFGAELARGLAAIAAQGFMVVEVFPESVPPSGVVGSVVTGPEFALTQQEAWEMYSTHLGEEEILQLWRQSGGAYADMVTLVNRHLALPPPVQPILGKSGVPGYGDAPSPGMLDFLLRERRWIDAFALAVTNSQHDTAVAIMGQAGEAFFEAGLFSHFWDLIKQLPDAAFDGDLPAYWLLSAAIANNRQDEVREFLHHRLQSRPLPNLRALMACSSMSSKSLEQAEQAFREETTVMTVRALAHCLSAFGRPHEALRVTLDNLPLVEPFATPRELANCSFTVSRILMFLGRYSAAHE